MGKWLTFPVPRIEGDLGYRKPLPCNRGRVVPSHHHRPRSKWEAGLILIDWRRHTYVLPHGYFVLGVHPWLRYSVSPP